MSFKGVSEVLQLVSGYFRGSFKEFSHGFRQVFGGISMIAG